eukprot:CAMPEP_0170230656 /NCGR_PEP_ID=MMETSP0116_2-20130129/15061_1 /TAXON_ID=400756 /ORGANISM="Durinskia baltica, Strain CSIRO CS-38" /LENGTH=424 /DNA_ID=CAMNT_0010481425 /DNA_START=80 /DNA_END=1351 /DNA_ORIENTATION=+
MVPDLPFCLAEIRAAVARAEEALHADRVRQEEWQKRWEEDRQRLASVDGTLTSASEAKAKALRDAAEAKQALIVAEAKVEKLEGKLDGKRKDIQSLEEQVESLEAKLEKKRGQVEKLTGSNQKLEAELHALARGARTSLTPAVERTKAKVRSKSSSSSSAAPQRKKAADKQDSNSDNDSDAGSDAESDAEKKMAAKQKRHAAQLERMEKEREQEKAKQKQKEKEEGVQSSAKKRRGGAEVGPRAIPGGRGREKAAKVPEVAAARPKKTAGVSRNLLTAARGVGQAAERGGEAAVTTARIEAEASGGQMKEGVRGKTAAIMTGEKGTAAQALIGGVAKAMAKAKAKNFAFIMSWAIVGMATGATTDILWMRAPTRCWTAFAANLADMVQTASDRTACSSTRSRGTMIGSADQSVLYMPSDNGACG